MWDHDCGFVPIVDAAGRVAGVVTDRDICIALAEMKRFRVRRLPVVTADGTLQGIVSMNDIVLASEQREGPAPADIVSTLAAICAHRGVTAAAA